MWRTRRLWIDRRGSWPPTPGDGAVDGVVDGVVVGEPARNISAKRRPRPHRWRRRPRTRRTCPCPSLGPSRRRRPRRRRPPGRATRHTLWGHLGRGRVQGRRRGDAGDAEAAHFLRAAESTDSDGGGGFSPTPSMADRPHDWCDPRVDVSPSYDAALMLAYTPRRPALLALGGGRNARRVVWRISTEACTPMAYSRWQRWTPTPSMALR